MLFSEISLIPKNINYTLIFNNSMNKLQTEEIICYNKFEREIYYHTEPTRVGFLLMEFINHFYRIQNEFLEFIHNISTLEDFKFENLYTYRNELYEKLKCIIPEETDLIFLTFDTFLYDIRYSYQKINFLEILQKIKNVEENKKYMEKLEDYIFEFDNFFEDNINLEHYDNEGLYVSTSAYGNYENIDKVYQKFLISFLKKYNSQLQNLYLYVTNSFSNKDNKNINSKRFTGIPINISNENFKTDINNQYAICLPYSENFFDIYHNNSEPKPTITRYFIRHFSDFVFCSLYNIIKSKVAINKCEYCGKYFITGIDNKERFCPDIDEYGNYRTKKQVMDTDELKSKYVTISKCKDNFTPKKRGRQQEFENEKLTQLMRKHRKRLKRKKRTEKGINEEKTLLTIDNEISRQHNLLKEIFRTDTNIIEEKLFEFANNLISEFENNINNKKYGNKNAKKDKE